MNELVFVLAFMSWYIISLVISENNGKTNKPGTEWLFFISIIFSPVIAGVYILYMKKKGL